jgi:hypothetical protein
MSDRFRELLGDILIIVYSVVLTACFVAFMVNGKYEHIIVILIIELVVNVLGIPLGVNRLWWDAKERVKK